MPFVDKSGQVLAPPKFVSVAIEQFEPVADHAEQAIGLAFESHVDGRPFSAAAMFRSEGYAGWLIGTGEVGLDRLAYGFRTGFDLLWVTPEELALLSVQHLVPFPDHYQLATAELAGGYSP